MLVLEANICYTLLYRRFNMVHLYARVSTTDQGASLPVQLSHMKKWVGNEPYIEYQEKGSGKDTDRPVLQSILSNIKKGDTLMVYDSSRLSRKTEDTLAIAKMLNDMGCFLNIGNRVIDLSNPVDKMSLSISASVDTFNREFQNLKSREGMDAKKQSGDWVMRGDLFGWTTYKTRGQTRADIDPTAAKYIEYIFTQYSTGRSANSLATELENVIIPGWEHYRFTACNITRMLQKTVYMGYYTPKKENVLKLSRQQLEDMLIKSNIYEGIVSPELWWKCFDSYRRVKRTHTKQFEYRWSFYELSTILKCPYCNAGFAHYYFKGQTKTLEKYKSLSHKSDCPDPCWRDFDKDAMELIVRTTLILTFLDHDEVECFFKDERDKVGLEKDELEKELKDIEKMLSQNKSKMEKLTDLALNDLIDRDILAERMGKLKAENTKLVNSKSSLLTLIRQKDTLIDDFYAEATIDVLDEYAHLEPTLRRETLQKYISHAYVRNEGFEIEFLNGKRFVTDMWKKKRKTLNPLTMTVSFKGTDQYRLSLSFNPQYVRVLDEDYGDEQTNKFFFNRNRRMEKEIDRWINALRN